MAEFFELIGLAALSDAQVALVAAAVMVVLLLMGFPMMVPLMVGAMVLLFSKFVMLEPRMLVQQMIGGVEQSVLVAVPMFILAADIMIKGNTADRLLDLVSKFVGHIRGGLPVTTAVSCTLFGAVSGSTQATVVAMGKPLRPKLLEAGYTDRFSMALIINSSDIALLIPPSIGMIIYGVASGTSVGELFIAGIGPGLMILALFAVYCYIISVWKKIPARPASSWGERLTALRRAVLAFGFPVIIIGGIYSGFFSPTEAASMSVAYALLLEMVIYREVKLSDLPGVALSTGMITAVVFILVAAGMGFSWIVSFAQIPELLLGDVVANAADNPLMVLALVAVAYFVGCMFVDPIVVILILTPIFSPAIASAGLDPVHVGTIVVLQAAIGSATPPFGCDIFTAVAIFRRPYLDVIAGTPPFVLILLCSTVLLILFPQIALFLPELMR
ncbi:MULTISPECIES: TRAP transporter large permease [unclassified Wenzhouxiangella]|uniref:TRAP transporter large permease n=1 Tax=unclassified Wenzhouxiangella TaxID=2613841 RepID=UPI000E32C0AE|nr:MULTISPECIES: TRAP transporter large permease [unclassified Wenzhouxiangella]RFF28817.1 TRAP transporter large permease [Wenzhouxiangella sp. 15181]RFP68206.1 TRAP transporter large permease [Wenzhouxiangella sp. 15190]